MTRNRSIILELLRNAEEPLAASEVEARAGGDFDTATVYRSLHYLEENGFAESFVLHCQAHGTQKYYSFATDGDGEPASHRHWFHCEQCHRFLDLGDCHVEKLVKDYERNMGISVHTHTLYLTGLCAKCGKAAAAPKRASPKRSCA